MSHAPTAACGWGALADAASTALDALRTDARWAGDAIVASRWGEALLHADLPGYRALPQTVEAWLSEAMGPTARARRWALSLSLMLSLHDRLKVSAFPRSMWDEWLGLAWRALERVKRHPVCAGQAWPEDWDDPWRKDLAALSLRAVPAVSHLVVPGAGLPRSWLLRGLWQEPGAALRVLVATGGRLRPYLENHVHPWMLSRFSPEGREACLRQVAQLLRLWPEARGLMGTSWYYDAALAEFSPKLAYLREVPQAHGAVFWAHDPSTQAAHDAALRSSARRECIERGAYVPRAVTMLWPRERLLASPWGVPA